MHYRQIGFSIRYALFKYVVRIVIVIFIVRKQPFNCMKIKQLLFLEVLLAHVGLFQCLLLHCLFLSSLYAFPCVSPHIPLSLLYPAIGHCYPPQVCFRFLPVFFFLSFFWIIITITKCCSYRREMFSFCLRSLRSLPSNVVPWNNLSFE